MSATISTEEVTAFINDPGLYFASSYTAMMSISPERLAELQLSAAKMRFAEHRRSIPMVQKLSSQQGIEDIASIDELLPLMFEHTMYKSYPQLLLEKLDFVSLTRWFDRLTSHDLSGLDATSCTSIDDWLALLDAEAGLDPMFSSGTTGTMSFIPWSVGDLRVAASSRRPILTQPFGSDASAFEGIPFHYATMVNRNRRDYIGPAMALGKEEFARVFEPGGQSADMIWLGGRLRLAAARGDASRVNVPDTLLARREEFAEREASADQRKREWIDSIVELDGKLIIWSAHPYAIVDIAAERLRQGQKCSFADGSRMNLTGGTKGHVLPEGWLTTVQDFVNMPVGWIYGMAEMSTTFKMCDAGRYHIAPWVIPFLLDPDTSDLLPRDGVREGRFAYFDLLPSSHWGGFITGDELEIDFSARCACGASSAHASSEVRRLSESRGGDDKITCAASPAAHAEAMAYLIDL